MGMKVVIGGSRGISRLNTQVIGRIENICNRGFHIFVGDANGIDKAVQQFLSDINYPEVTVFCMPEGCRNNIGLWPIRRVDSQLRQKSFKYYSRKDREMAKEADYGFMIWNSRSKGSLSNMIFLLELNKKCLVYFSPKKIFVDLKNSEDLVRLLSYCTKEALESFEKTLQLSEKIKALTFRQTILDLTD